MFKSCFLDPKTAPMFDLPLREIATSLRAHERFQVVWAETRTWNDHTIPIQEKMSTWTATVVHVAKKHPHYIPAVVVYDEASPVLNFPFPPPAADVAVLAVVRQNTNARGLSGGNAGNVFAVAYSGAGGTLVPPPQQPQQQQQQLLVGASSSNSSTFSQQPVTGGGSSSGMFSSSGGGVALARQDSQTTDPEVCAPFRAPPPPTGALVPTGGGGDGKSSGGKSVSFSPSPSTEQQQQPQPPKEGQEPAESPKEAKRRLEGLEKLQSGLASDGIRHLEPLVRERRVVVWVEDRQTPQDMILSVRTVIGNMGLEMKWFSDGKEALKFIQENLSVILCVQTSSLRSSETAGNGISGADICDEVMRLREAASPAAAGKSYPLTFLRTKTVALQDVVQRCDVFIQIQDSAESRQVALSQVACTFFKPLMVWIKHRPQFLGEDIKTRIRNSGHSLVTFDDTDTAYGFLVKNMHLISIVATSGFQANELRGHLNGVELGRRLRRMKPRIFLIVVSQNFTSDEVQLKASSVTKGSSGSSTSGSPHGSNNGTGGPATGMGMKGARSTSFGSGGDLGGGGGGGGHYDPNSNSLLATSPPITTANGGIGGTTADPLNPGAASTPQSTTTTTTAKAQFTTTSSGGAGGHNSSQYYVFDEWIQDNDDWSHNTIASTKVVEAVESYVEAKEKERKKAKMHALSQSAIKRKQNSAKVRAKLQQQQAALASAQQSGSSGNSKDPSRRNSFLSSGGDMAGTLDARSSSENRCSATNPSTDGVDGGDHTTTRSPGDPPEGSLNGMMTIEGYTTAEGVSFIGTATMSSTASSSETNPKKSGVCGNETADGFTSVLSAASSSSSATGGDFLDIPGCVIFGKNVHIQFANTFPCELEFEGQIYPSIEHFYQAAKHLRGDPDLAKQIRESSSIHRAFQISLSRKIDQRVWNALRDNVMKFALNLKFSQPQFRDVLLATESKDLILHIVDDTYWGNGGDGAGENRLGQLLMNIRDLLKANAPLDFTSPFIKSKTQAPALYMRDNMMKKSLFTVLYDQKIGEGGFGVVYKAIDNFYGTLVAVKEANLDRRGLKRGVGTAGDDESFQNLQAEFDLMSKLTNPFIVRVFHAEFDQEKGKAKIFMEWMPHGSVEHRLHLGRLYELAIRNYIFQMLEGLEYLHSQQVIHGDIKPANVLLNEGGAKLSDFGLSRIGATGNNNTNNLNFNNSAATTSTTTTTTTSKQQPPVTSSMDLGKTDDSSASGVYENTGHVESNDTTSSSKGENNTASSATNNTGGASASAPLSGSGGAASPGGTSSSPGPPKQLKFLGTPQYMSPERYQDTTSQTSFSDDIWAVGISAIRMALGGSSQPWAEEIHVFGGDIIRKPMDRFQIAFQLYQGQRPAIPPQLSEPCNDFISQCLIPDPKHRPTAVQLMSHAWFSISEPAEIKGIEDIREYVREFEGCLGAAAGGGGGSGHNSVKSHGGRSRKSHNNNNNDSDQQDDNDNDDDDDGNNYNDDSYGGGGGGNGDGNSFMDGRSLGYTGEDFGATAGGPTGFFSLPQYTSSSGSGGGGGSNLPSVVNPLGMNSSSGTSSAQLRNVPTPSSTLAGSVRSNLNNSSGNFPGTTAISSSSANFININSSSNNNSTVVPSSSSLSADHHNSAASGAALVGTTTDAFSSSPSLAMNLSGTHRPSSGDYPPLDPSVQQQQLLQPSSSSLTGGAATPEELAQQQQQLLQARSPHHRHHQENNQQQSSSVSPGGSHTAATTTTTTTSSGASSSVPGVSPTPSPPPTTTTTNNTSTNNVTTVGSGGGGGGGGCSSVVAGSSTIHHQPTNADYFLFGVGPGGVADATTPPAALAAAAHHNSSSNSPSSSSSQKERRSSQPPS